MAGLAWSVRSALSAAAFFPIASDQLRQQKVMQLGDGARLLSTALCSVQLCCSSGWSAQCWRGFFFGLWWGFLIILMGNVLGAAISFVISRWIGRRWLQRKLLRNSRIEALKPAVDREGWKIIFLSQLHPLFPTSLLNYVYGLSTVRFRTCILWVAIGQMPGLFLYAYVGTLDNLGLTCCAAAVIRSWRYWLWGGGLALSLAILVALSRVSLRL